MVIDQSIPKTSWVHGDCFSKVRVRLCNNHAKPILKDYNTETYENKSLKVFMPKLKSDHELGGCEVLGCCNPSSYIAYGLTYKLDVNLD